MKKIMLSILLSVALSTLLSSCKEADIIDKEPKPNVDISDLPDEIPLSDNEDDNNQPDLDENKDVDNDNDNKDQDNDKDEDNEEQTDLEENEDDRNKDSYTQEQNNSNQDKDNDNENEPQNQEEELAIATYSSLSFFKNEYSQRYANYLQLKPDITPEKAVAYVNIGLDNEFYSNTVEVSNPADVTELVNKYRSLPSSYEPYDLELINSEFSTKNLYLRKEAKDAFEQMCQQAKSDGYDIKAMSTYRSYQTQKRIYDNYVASDGKVNADTYSARPGFSEHQTGLAIDVQSGNMSFLDFGSTKAYSWVKENAKNYGFIIRYTVQNQPITGYMSEAWHLRYVGVNIANDMASKNIDSFDEYYVMYLD